MGLLSRIREPDRALPRCRGEFNARTEGGVTALFCSTFDALVEKGATELLLSAGAEVDATDQSGTTPLMIAARRVNLAVVEVLLQGGAEPNLQDVDGMTALMFAATARASDLQIYTEELLLNQGADIRLRNREGKTALMLARENNNEGIVHLLEYVADHREEERP